MCCLYWRTTFYSLSLMANSINWEVDFRIFKPYTDLELEAWWNCILRTFGETIWVYYRSLFNLHTSPKYTTVKYIKPKMHSENQWWPRLKYTSDLFLPLTLTKTLRKNFAKVKTKMQIIELQIQNSRYESRKLHPQHWWWTSLNIFIYYLYLLTPSLKNKDADNETANTKL